MKYRSIKKYVLCWLAAGFFLTACGPREIPDDKMAAIIHDVFLVNAYVNNSTGNRITDSVNIYEPIFKKYGYDAEDFRYSMERMTLKKSSRLAELIDKATVDINEENIFYEARARIAERVDTLITLFYQDTVLNRPDSFWMRDVRKKSELVLRLPAREGNYRVSYNYLVDTTDKTNYLMMRYKLLDSLGKTVNTNSRTLSRGSLKKMNVSFDADQKADSIEIILADYPDNASRVSLRIDSLLVLYNVPLDSVRKYHWRDHLNLTALKKHSPYYEPIAQDSSAFHVVPPLRPDTARHTDL